MTANEDGRSTDQIFRDKSARRREIAKLPVEEKYRMLIKLQHMVVAVDVKAGRKPRRPWDVKLKPGD